MNDTNSTNGQYGAALNALLHIGYAVGSVMELPAILTTIAKETVHVTGADGCMIFLKESQGPGLRLRAAHGIEITDMDAIHILPGQGIIGHCWQSGEIQAVSDVSQDPRLRPLPQVADSQFRSLLTAPMRIQKEPIGVMTMRVVECRDFSQSEIMLFETICQQVAIVIEKARLYHNKIEAERRAATAEGLSEIAHYIKNLLMGFEGGAYMMDKALKDENIEMARTGWGMLTRSQRKISDLVANMLSYSASDARPVFRHGDLNDLLREVVAEGRIRCESNESTFEETYDGAVGTTEFDADMLHDAFLNLLCNAIDALPKGGGRIGVITRNNAESNRVEIELSDTGSGIPEGNRAKIFNLFFTTKGTKGTGIGLAAVKKRVEAHGGGIDFISQPGEGTTFRVWLPKHPEAQGALIPA